MLAGLQLRPLLGEHSGKQLIGGLAEKTFVAIVNCKRDFFPHRLIIRARFIQQLGALVHWALSSYIEEHLHLLPLVTGDHHSFQLRFTQGLALVSSRF
jgi:hypothetical protein